MTTELPPMTPKVKEALDSIKSLADGLKARSDNAYIQAIDNCRANEALGSEIKMEKGIFGKKELESHKYISELFGRHKAMHEAYVDLSKAIDAIRESIKQSPPAPSAAAPDVVALPNTVEEWMDILFVNSKEWTPGHNHNMSETRWRDLSQYLVKRFGVKSAPLRVDREEVARAIEQASGQAPFHFSQWPAGYKEIRFRQADAAISAMGAEPVDVEQLKGKLINAEAARSYLEDQNAKHVAERDAARAELAELRKLVEGQKADANNFLLEVGRLENKHNKKES